MGQLFQPIRNLFAFHKLKMLLVLALSVVFFITFFPSRELSDWVSSQVTLNSGIYTQFDEIGINLVPSPGISATQVLVEPPFLPALKAKSAQVAVSILSALTGKMGVSAHAQSLFKGDVDVDLNEGEKLKSGERVKFVDLKLTRVSLEELAEYLRNGNMLAMALQGSMNLTSSLRLDALFNEQPNGTIGADITSFAFPSQTVPTQLGPMQTPPISLSKLTLQAKMNEGNLDIQNLTLGAGKDDISGKVTGNVGVQFRREPGGVRPLVGNSYDLAIDLTIKKSYLEANGKSGIEIMLDMVKDYKKDDTPTSVRYAFRMKAGANGMPQMTKM